MKNLLIYCRADGKFSIETTYLVKIQIDNSLSLGWNPKDILLFTNFPYEYNGIKSTLIPDLSYKPDRTNKIPAIVYLLDQELLPDDVIWYHDFDAYQDMPFNPSLESDMAFTSYGYKDQWNCGSFFFKLTAKNVFLFWNRSIVASHNSSRVDEKTLTDLTKTFKIGPSCYQTAYIGYNYGQRLHEFPEYDEVDRAVLHFHPHYRYYKAQYNNLEIFKYGKNRLGIPLMSDRLSAIFDKHGIK